MKTGVITIRTMLILMLLPASVSADQTDTRLNGLFDTLRVEGNAFVQSETIGAIWRIWYESGREDIDSLMQEGEVALKSGQLKKAELVFTRITESAPDFAEGWNRRATVRYNRLDYAGSLADISRTLALEPRHFGAYWGRGMILGLQRNFTGAIEAFENMLHIVPFSEDAARRLLLLKKELRKESV